MKTSSLCKIVHTRKLLSSFDEDAAKEFGQNVWDVLGCTTESSFWETMYWFMVGGSLDYENIKFLKDVAVQISDKEKKKKKNKKSQDKNTINHFSKLSSDTIDYFGSFLTKKERVYLSYLNRDLFIETQKQSFLLNSSNDQFVSIYTCLPNGITFSQCYPTKVSLTKIHGGIPSQFGQFESGKSQWFKYLFTRVDTVTCQDARWMPYLPIDVLFDYKKLANNNTNTKTREIKMFHLQFMSPISSNHQEKMQNNLNIFVKNYQNYWQNECGRDLAKISNIDRVILTQNFNFPKQIFSLDCKELLLSLSPNFRHLEITGPWKIDIETMDQFQSIFHCNLKSLTLCCDPEISIPIVSTKEEQDTECKRNQYQLARLEKFCFVKWNSMKKMPQLFNECRKRINRIDNFGLRQNLKSVEIIDKSSSLCFLYNEFDLLLNTILQYNGQCRKDVIFTIEQDSHNLMLLQGYFNHLCQNKDCINNGSCFSSIKFNIRASVRKEQLFETRYNFGMGMGRIPVVSQVFDTNSDKIIMDSFDFSLQSFEALYENIIDWFQRIKEEKISKESLIDEDDIVFPTFVVSRVLVFRLHN